MCSRDPGCVPGNPCLNAWVDPWSCTLVDTDPRCVLVPQMCSGVSWSGTRWFLVGYQDVMMCNLLLLSRDGP
jgi:hypothetical protein